MAGNLMPTLDYLVTAVQGQVGHSRVYNRIRSTRSRAQFETLFVGSTGMDYWTARRTLTTETHAGMGCHSHRVHTIEVVGTRATADVDADGDSSEIQLRLEVEALVELFRQDPSLGWNVQLAKVVSSSVDPVQVASVACHRGRVTLDAREDCHW